MNVGFVGSIIESFRRRRYRRYQTQMEDGGFSLVHGFLPASAALELRSSVMRLYELLGHRPIEDELLRHHFTQWQGVWMLPVPDFLQTNDPTTFAVYQRAVKKVEETTRLIFGPQWTPSPQVSFYRRHTGAARHLPWHIDADAANTREVRTINVWLPLDRVGTLLPSLEVIPLSSIEMKKLPLRQHSESSLSDSFAQSKGKPVAPKLNLGDAIIFDSFTLHRTQPISGNSVRTACEFRFSYNARSLE